MTWTNICVPEDAGLNQLMMYLEVRGHAVLVGQIDTKDRVVEYRVCCRRWENAGGVEVDDPRMLATEAANVTKL
jgi:hypothetical protein